MCIKDQDHHCLWINNCISHRNHYIFLFFLVSLILYTSVALYIILVNKESRTNIRNIVFSILYIIALTLSLIQFKNSIKYQQNMKKKKNISTKSK